jgi:hypothetical protein
MDWDDFVDIIQFILFVVCLFIFIIGSLLIPAWYACGIQSEMYKRHGIIVSQKELFCGAKPPEYNINLKENKK